MKTHLSATIKATKVVLPSAVIEECDISTADIPNGLLGAGYTNIVPSHSQPHPKNVVRRFGEPTPGSG